MMNTTVTEKQVDTTPLPDALNFDGLERRGNYRTIAYRQDVLHVFDRRDNAAIIYQIVERWQKEYKKPEVLRKIEERKKAGLKPYTPEELEDMMFVYMSYNDFVRESGGAVGYNSVIRTLDYLIDTKKALKQRPNHNPNYPDFEYSIDKKVMRKLLKGLPVEPLVTPKIPKKKKHSTQMGTPDTSTHLGIPDEENGSTHLGRLSTQMGRGSTQTGTEVYPNGGTSHNYTHTTHIEHTENDGDDANAHHALTPLLQHDFILLDDLMVPTLMVVKIQSSDASTDEDKRRIHIASWELMPVFLEQGLKVELRYEQETPSGSYSQQDATGNALVENGEDHDTTRSRRPRVDNHGFSDNAVRHTLHAAADPSRTTQAQQPTLENDNNSHSHSQEEPNGHIVGDAAHLSAHGRGTAGLHRSDGDVAGEHPQTNSRPATTSVHATSQRNTALRGSGHEGDASLQGVAHDALTLSQGQAKPTTGRAAADVVGQAEGGSMDVPAASVTHQGRAQTDATPSLSVENPVAVGGNSKPVGKGNKATDEEKKPKVELTPEERDRANALKAVIRAQRGYDLSSKGAIIDENKCIVALVKNRADQDMIDAFKYLTKFDFKWSKTDFKFKVGGRVLFDEIDRVLQQFAENPQLRANLDGPPAATWRGRPSAPGRQISSFDDPNYDMSVEFYPSEAEKAARRMQHAGQC